MITEAGTTALRDYVIEDKVLEQVRCLQALSRREVVSRLNASPVGEYQAETIVIMARLFIRDGAQEQGWCLLRLLAGRVSRRVQALLNRAASDVTDRSGLLDELITDLMICWSSSEARQEFWAARFFVTLDRVVLSACRRAQRNAHRSLDAVAPGDREPMIDRLPAPEGWSAVDRIAAQQAVVQLPDQHRMPFVLRHLFGLKEADIAQATGVSVRTVRTRLGAAKRQLRAVLMDDGEASP